MTRITRTSRARKAVTQARAEGEREAERYSGAFERVRLVRAWIAVAVAVVAMLSGYVTLLERLVH